MKQKGTVMKTEGDRALVAVPRVSACGEHCASCPGGCQARGHLAWADNPAGARPGDRVLLYASDRAVLLGAAVVYGLPLLLFFIGYGAAFTLTDSMPLAAAVSLVCLLGGFCSLRLLDKAMAPKPRIIEIIRSNG